VTGLPLSKLSISAISSACAFISSARRQSSWPRRWLHAVPGAGLERATGGGNRWVDGGGIRLGRFAALLPGRGVENVRQPQAHRLSCLSSTD